MRLNNRDMFRTASMVVAVLALASNAHAKTAEELTIALDTIWVVLTASLVFFMNLGFALVESGFCRSKNTVNILSKNFIVFAISCLAFYVFGWGLMFGNGSGFVGSEGLFTLGGADNSPATGDAYMGAYSGDRLDRHPAVREVLLSAGVRGHGRHDRLRRGGRTHQVPVVHRVLLPAGGVRLSDRRSLDLGRWLARAGGFWDFAGSTVVHSVGGWAALAGVIVLGPRLGRYGADGKVNPIPGHSMTSGVIGCFVLWLGWFGFNPGLDDGRRSERDRSRLHDHEHGCVHGLAVGDGAQLDVGR